MGAAFEHPTPNLALKRDVPQAARPLALRSASDCIYPKQWSTIPTCKSLPEP